MANVLIFQELIPHYRIPLFNGIAQDPNIDLTVAHDVTKPFKNSENNSFKTLPYHNKKIKSFFYIKNILKLIKNFDQVIFIADLRWLPTFLILLLNKGDRKIYFWGIGVSSQQGIRKKPILDKIRFLLSDLSSGTILYSKKIADYYLENVKKKNQIYVAANTIKVEKFSFPTDKRYKILSIGSFTKYKNLENLIIAFNNIIDKIPAEVTLDFIGDGEQEHELKAAVARYGLEKRVIFWGRKENDADIFEIASSALVSVSPTQAGLALLHAMALGCPFLTSYDAVTGGERYYIEDNVNSYFYDGTIEGLSDKLMWIINDPDHNNNIARSAYEFYHNNCSIDNYSGSFIDIINGHTKNIQ